MKGEAQTKTYKFDLRFGKKSTCRLHALAWVVSFSKVAFHFIQHIWCFFFENPTNFNIYNLNSLLARKLSFTSFNWYFGPFLASAVYRKILIIQNIVFYHANLHSLATIMDISVNFALRMNSLVRSEHLPSLNHSRTFQLALESIFCEYEWKNP